MSMISHQNVSVNLTLVSSCGPVERMQIEFVVAGLEEYCLMVHAALYYVLGNIRDKIARLSRHDASSAKELALNSVTAGRGLPDQKLRFDPNY